MVSAHWEAAPVALSSTTGAPLLYDFWGFPPAALLRGDVCRAAAQPAARAEGLLTDAGLSVARDESRGLDHGAYVPLVEMYLEADIPVVQLSPATLDPRTLFAVGERLAPLREEGTLIVGSGFTTHNLGWFNPGAAPPTGRRPAPRESSTTGPTRRCGLRTSTRCWTCSPRPRRHARPTGAPSIGRRSTSLWARQPRRVAGQSQCHRRILVRLVEALLATGRMTPGPLPPTRAHQSAIHSMRSMAEDVRVEGVVLAGVETVEVGDLT